MNIVALKGITVLLVIIKLIPASFFNAVLVCFFVLLFREHGLTFQPQRAFKALAPVLRAVAFGVLPAAIIGNLAAFLIPAVSRYLDIILLIGILVSGILLYRNVMSRVHKHTAWNIAVLVMTLSFIALGTWGL
ncbi:MAG: hypothetical protein ABJ251_05060 [Paracoccaceae bacterium]